MSLDLTFGKLAIDLINKYGKVVTLKQISNGEYDVSFGELLQTTNTSTIKISPPTDSEYFDVKTNLQVNVKTCYISGSLIPKLGDVLTIDSKDFTILDIKSLYSGQLIAAYKLVLNK